MTRHSAATRLLNVNSYHYPRGGADNVYFRHAEMFAALGWRNAYFAMHHPQNLPSEWSEYFVDELQHGHEYGVVQKALMATKVVWSFEAQRKLRRLLAAFEPDVAHLHNIYHHLSPSILSEFRAAGVPAVMTAHDLKLACPSNKMFNDGGVCERCKGGNYLNVVRHACVQGSRAASAIVAVEAWSQRLLRSYARHLDRIVVPSRFFLEKFVEWGWPRDRFEYIPNWADTADTAFDPTPGDYFLYFGRLSGEKGVETAVRAAVAAGVPLAVAGEGPLREPLERLAEGAGGAIRFLGFQRGEALAALVRGSRAVLVPSECYENAPLALIEAYAAGKPVIGSRLGGIPELVDEERTGWLFPAGDADALADVLRRVRAASDSTLRPMGVAARALVERDFSRARYQSDMLGLYRRLGVRIPAAA
jgi:glycosyltransferase involved in cell wall biosynthesis